MTQKFVNLSNLNSSIYSPHKVTLPVKAILDLWIEILTEMSSLSSDSIFEKLYKYDFPSDMSKSQNFLKTYQADPHDGDFIVNNQSYMKYYNSVMLYYKGIKFGFPFQCRQWSNSNILNRIFLRIIKHYKIDKEKVDIPTFLIIWESERNREIIDLNPNDIMILRAINNYSSLKDLENSSLIKSSKMLINSNIISKNTGISKSNTNNRINKMWIQGVLSIFYITNPVNLNFVTTTRTEELPKNYENFLLVKVPFPDSPFYIYQVPNNYSELKYNSILNELEMGYSLANLRPKGRIISKFYRDLYDEPLAVESTSKIIDLQPQDLEVNRKEISFLKQFTPAIFSLDQKAYQLKDILGLSTSTIDQYINKFLSNQLIYQFSRILFVGFPINVAIYIRAKREDIIQVKSYLRQYFRYYIYTNENELFAYLRMTETDFKVISMTMAEHKNNFKKFDMIKWDSIINSGIQIKKSIDWRKLDFEIDPFFGIKWHQPFNDSKN